ncbi:MAG: nodulation protein NfeD [Sphingomonadales bacterium]
MRYRWTQLLSLAALAIGLALTAIGWGLGSANTASSQSPAPQNGGQVFAATLDGAIGPAMAGYVEHALSQAAEAGAAALVLKMDTPGGLDSAMRDIIRAILASPVPVLTYVAPSGARAASAGTYILYASHVAAMAPGTNLGAATPVAIGGGGLPMPGGDQPKPSQEPGKDPGNNQAEEPAKPDAPAEPSKAKAVNDAVAYIRALAEMRGRNADWAEQAVRQAASLSAQAALERQVIDIVAGDIGDLLAQSHGRVVTVGGNALTLATEGLSVQPLEPDWRTKILAAITNPNVALILMMIGIYGLIFEFMNPGAVYPGTIGAISLLIGLYALGTLPVNYAGLALMLLGIALMVAEAFAPSFGVLGVGGTAAFVLGATILIDTDAPGFGISWAIIAAVVAASLLLTLIIVPMAVGALRRRVVTGAEEMIGSIAEVKDWQKGKGHVFVHGERWRAVSNQPLETDQRVKVVGLDGLVLKVAPDQEK